MNFGVHKHGVKNCLILCFSAQNYNLHKAAMCGLLGDIVRKIEPHTESDPAALAIQTTCGHVVQATQLLSAGALLYAQSGRTYK